MLWSCYTGIRKQVLSGAAWIQPLTSTVLRWQGMRHWWVFTHQSTRHGGEGDQFVQVSVDQCSMPFLSSSLTEEVEQLTCSDLRSEWEEEEEWSTVCTSLWRSENTGFITSCSVTGTPQSLTVGLTRIQRDLGPCIQTQTTPPPPKQKKRNWIRKRVHDPAGPLLGFLDPPGQRPLPPPPIGCFWMWNSKSSSQPWTESCSHPATPPVSWAVCLWSCIKETDLREALFPLMSVLQWRCTRPWVKALTLGGLWAAVSKWSDRETRRHRRPII